MQNQPFEAHAQLAGWLHRLVEILRERGGSTWRDLVQTVSGKTAAIELDGIRLRVRTLAEERLQIATEFPIESAAVNFRCEGETLRDIIAGRLTLDGALASEKIYLEGSAQELTGIYKVVMGILADSAVSPELRRLWAEFDESRSRLSSPPPCHPLEYQRPLFGELIRQVPEDVLNVQIQLPEE